MLVRGVEFLGWELLTYEHRSDISEELAKRNIQINQNADIGDFPRIWNDVTINSGAIVGHNVTIGMHCRIGDNVWIGDSVRMEKFVTVMESASIDEGSYIGQAVRIGENARVGRNSYIGRGAEIPAQKEVTTISFNLGKHTVYYWGTDVLQIGCKVFHIDSWSADFKGIGQRERYSPKQIELYGMAIAMVRKFQRITRTAQPPTAPAPLGDNIEGPGDINKNLGLPSGDTVTFGGEPRETFTVKFKGPDEDFYKKGLVTVATKLAGYIHVPHQMEMRHYADIETFLKSWEVLTYPDNEKNSPTIANDKT